MGDTDAQAGGPSKEEKIGSTDDSERRPPHVTEAEKKGGDDEGRPTDNGPDLPATAHGEDKVPAEEQGAGVDPESMYEGRPEEDKDVSPEDQVKGKAKDRNDRKDRG